MASVKRSVFWGAILMQFAIGVVVGEAALRFCAMLNKDVGRLLSQHDPMAVSIVPHGRFGYRQRPHSVFHYGNGTTAISNALGYRGPLVTIPKPPGTYRIVLLGGSTTHGWGVGDDETIDAHMRRLLAERYPGRSFEVVNLAFDGYDSHQLVERLRTEGPWLEADLIIVNAGINDVRNTRFADLADPDPRTLIWEDVLRRLRVEMARGGPDLWTWIKHHSYLARIPSMVRQYWSSLRATENPREMHPNLAAADLFERNLERICTLAEQMQVPVMFSSPPSSLRIRYTADMTRNTSYWIKDSATTQQLREELARRMRRVVTGEVDRRRDVTYVAHELSREMFLDDAHLTGRGNLQMASDFVAAAAMYTSKGK